MFHGISEVAVLLMSAEPAVQVIPRYFAGPDNVRSEDFNPCRLDMLQKRRSGSLKESIRKLPIPRRSTQTVAATLTEKERLTLNEA